MNREVVAARHRRFRSGKEIGIGLLLLTVIVAVAWAWIGGGDPAREHVEAGRALIQANRGPEAEQEWKQAARLNPNNAAAWELLARYYTQHDDATAAVEPLRHLAQLRPDTPHVFNMLAEAAFRADDPLALKRQAESALQRNPNDVAALSIAAKMLTKGDDESRRLSNLRRLVALRPDDTDFQALLARALTSAHLYEEAAPLIERMLRSNPNNAEPYSLRGRRWLDTGTTREEYSRSEADFQKALTLNPQGPMPHLYLGKLYVRMGDPARAIDHLELAERAMPDRPEVYYVLAAAFTQAKQPDKAAAARARFAALRQQEDLMSSLTARCTADPNSFEDHLRMGLACLRKGDLDKADFYLNRAEALRPSDPRPKDALKQLATADSRQ